jgi:hypothetical protein
LKQISSSSKTNKKLADDDPYDIYTIHSRKIQKAVQDNRVNVSAILEPISAAVRNVTNDGNSKEELQKKYEAFFNSVGQLLNTYDIYSIYVSNSFDPDPNAAVLMVTKHGLHKDDIDIPVKVDNIHDVLSQLDRVELILLKLINEIIEKVDHNRERIEEIESAIEWVNGIARINKVLPKKRHKHKIE